MNTKKLALLFSILMLAIIFSFDLAEAANGNLTIIFKYNDPVTGLEQNLNYGYVYLRDAAKNAPMEKFFSKADYILGGPAYTVNGKMTVGVPAGRYYIRLLQRKVIGGATRPYGPPEGGDLTWFQTTPVTITAGATLDLGTRYASTFGSTPITVTGIVRNYSGAPIAGRYVRATTEPCYADGYNYNINQCGPNKFLALQPTDVNGNYRLELREPGTYYLSVITSWDSRIGCSGYCAPPIIGTGQSATPIMVQKGESRSADLVGY